MSTFRELIANVFQNYLGEILAAITVFLLILLKRLWKNLRNMQKLKEGTLVWSPENKNVCFVVLSNGRWELNIYNVQANRKTKLDVPVAKGQVPTWSPDGKRIALVSDLEGNKEIYVVNADGSNVRRITDDPAEDICPQWSADGSKLTYFTRKNGFLIIKTVDIAETD